jgi:DNA-binding GntR family transcriptional regulator
VTVQADLHSMTSSPFQTKTEQVYNDLRQRILSGVLISGTRLPLATVAKQLHTSTIPVREALRMLSQERLVVIENHKGATVAELFFEGAADLVASRLWLEIYAARQAINHHTPETLRQLEEYLTRMNAATETADGAGFNVINREFHTALYAPGNNNVVKRTIQELWDQVWRDRSGAAVEVDQDRMRAANGEHLLIVKAVESKSWPALQAAMTLHMEETVKCWRRVSSKEAT